MTYRKERVERPQLVDRYYDVRCSGCEKELEPGFGDHQVEEDGAWDNLQAVDTLDMHLSGGYPTPWDMYSEHFLLCETCVEKLKNLFPLIGERLARHEKGEDDPHAIRNV